MSEIILGKSDIRLSSLIMGMWQAGKQYWVGIEDKDTLSAVSAALDSGITTFDTAEEYGGGHSEKILGQALKGRRDKAVILTKVFSNHLTAAGVVEACERSLKNLGTDYIDLYQIHWPSGSWKSEVVPISETMGALNELKRAGKIRSIGVSNFSVAQMREAMEYGQIDSLQSPYSLFWRFLEADTIPFCEGNHVSLLAYSPLSQGALTGKFQAGHVFAKGDNRTGSKLFDQAVFPEVLAALGKLDVVAKRKNVPLAQLALAWVISHKNAAAIVGVRNAEQVSQNAAAAQIYLSASDRQEMEKAVESVARKFIHDPVPWHWEP